MFRGPKNNNPVYHLKFPSNKSIKRESKLVYFNNLFAANARLSHAYVFTVAEL